MTRLRVTAGGAGNTAYPLTQHQEEKEDMREQKAVCATPPQPRWPAQEVKPFPREPEEMGQAWREKAK